MAADFPREYIAFAPMSPKPAGDAPPIEEEVKLAVASVEEARRRLAAAGAQQVRARHFEDNRCFDTPEGRLGFTGRLLRLRETRPAAGAGPGLLTYKGPAEAGPTKRRPEVETPVGDPAATRRLLEAVGFRTDFHYQKYRTVFHLDAVEVVLDETPIGCFLEIAGSRSAIAAAAGKLGFTPEEYLTDSYAGLYRQSGREPADAMLFPEEEITP